MGPGETLLPWNTKGQSAHPFLQSRSNSLHDIWGNTHVSRCSLQQSLSVLPLSIYHLYLHLFNVKLLYAIFMSYVAKKKAILTIWYAFTVAVL